MWIKFVVVKIVLLMLKYRNAVSYIFENLTLLILMYFIKFCSSTSALHCMAAECCAQSICSFTVWSIFQIGFTKNMIESICGYENDLFPTTVICTKDISFDNLMYILLGIRLQYWVAETIFKTFWFWICCGLKKYYKAYFFS